MNAMDRIKKAKVAIMRHQKFCVYSGVLACGKHVIDDTINPPTACTNGLDVRYHSAFVDKLSDPQLRFLILHEGQHIAYRHLHTWAALCKEDPRLTNVAADHFVNLSLVDMDAGEGFVAMPDVGVQPDPKYRGWSVRQIFDDLKQQGGDDPDNPDGDGGGFDHHDWEAGQQRTKAEVEDIAQQIDRALRQGVSLARMRGLGSAGADGAFDDLLAPQKDWRELLRDFVTAHTRGRDTSTWDRPHRRYIGDGVYMPSSISETVGPLVVGIDTSGSCFGSDYMTVFISELKAIVADVVPEAVRVVYWDTEVTGEDEFDSPGQFEVNALHPKGGGGTDGSVIFDHLRTKQVRPAAVIQFTDGYVGDWGYSDIPTLWAITDQAITAPWGTTVRIEV